MKRLKSSSSENTKKFAAELAAEILARGPGREAAVLALEGDLGAGKTTFVQGFFRGLGVKKAPASPTFILMRRTALKGGPFRDVFHIDAYRAGAEDFAALGLRDIFAEPGNIVLIEWAGRIKKLLPKGARRIKFAHGRLPEERHIRLGTMR